MNPSNPPEISIIYRHYILDDWIEEFGTNIGKFDVSFKKAQNEDKSYSFTGTELPGIILFIRDNPESIFLAPALYDVAKAGVIALYTKLRKLSVQKIHARDAELRERRISILYQDAQQRQIIINIEGDHDSELIEKIVEESFEIIRTDKKDDFFMQPDFVDDSQGNETIVLEYNSKNKAWEPKNFGEIRRKMGGYQEWAGGNSNS